MKNLPRCFSEKCSAMILTDGVKRYCVRDDVRSSRNPSRARVGTKR